MLGGGVGCGGRKGFSPPARRLTLSVPLGCLHAVGPAGLQGPLLPAEPGRLSCLPGSLGPAGLSNLPAVLYGACVSKGKIHGSPPTAEKAAAALCIESTVLPTINLSGRLFHSPFPQHELLLFLNSSFSFSSVLHFPCPGAEHRSPLCLPWVPCAGRSTSSPGALTLPSVALQNLEKQMRQLAVIPPMLYDADQQRIKFINMNGLMADPMKVYKDRQVMNMWSEQEKETFREK